MVITFTTEYDMDQVDKVANPAMNIIEWSVSCEHENEIYPVPVRGREFGVGRQVRGRPF